ncbi:hypothetical protein [Kitasatospora sp. NPDC085464]|uniref:hypothetical protein n=1 Tax=Kitasatospora sp. NPDC085464 TaxID=3364063 RepID=UPI0037CC7413
MNVLVEVGQVWQDVSSRSGGRRLRVDAVDATHATLQPVAVTPQNAVVALPQRATRIRLDRFEPHRLRLLLGERVPTASAQASPMVLTVRQPWAWAIIHAGKDIENRSRLTRLRGTLLIHAGRRWADAGEAALKARGIDVPAEARRYGHIVGAVTVTGSTQDSASSWAVPGMWHWELTQPIAADQLVMCQGKLGMFRAPDTWRDAFAGSALGRRLVLEGAGQ